MKFSFCDIIFTSFEMKNRIQLDNSTDSGDQNKGSHINISGCAMLAPFLHDLNLRSTKIIQIGSSKFNTVKNTGENKTAFKSKFF